MRCWIDFWTILGASWGPCGVPFGLRDATGTLPRRSKTLSRRSQDAPKTLKDANKAPQEAPRWLNTPPSSILLEFLMIFIDFSQIFHWIFIDFPKGFPALFFTIFEIILGLSFKYSSIILGWFREYFGGILHIGNLFSSPFASKNMSLSEKAILWK